MFNFCRPNIFLHIDAVKDNFEEALKWLPGHLQINDKTVKKIIIYIRSINACQQIFNWILDELGDHIFSGERDPKNKIADMFHANTDEESKARIMEQCISSDGKLRLLISTVAFGMGVNIRDVDLIIHWGVPTSSLSYWQEIGRCTRDGRLGYAMCYAFKRSVSKCKDEALKSFLTKENDAGIPYIRENILKMFHLKGMQDTALLELPKYSNKSHANCQDTCVCGKCMCCTDCASLCNCEKKVEDRLEHFLNN